MKHFIKHSQQHLQPTIGGTTYWSSECVPMFNKISSGFIEGDGYA